MTSVLALLTAMAIAIGTIGLVRMPGQVQQTGGGAPSPASQVAPPAAPAPVTRIDPKAQALLDRAIQALGGPAFMNFKTMSSEGRAFSIADGVTAGFVYYKSAMEYPDKRRLAYGFGKSKPIVLINNGDKGWEIDRYGLVEQKGKQIKNWRLANRYSLENFLRLRLREPGVLALTAGQDFIDNLPASILDVYDSRHVEIKLYINSLTGLPLRITYRIQDRLTLDWNVYSDSYSDYRLIGGVETPMHITRYLNDDRVAETFRTSVKYNETLPSGYFQPGE
ncbi:MAG: hypothetical protein ACRD3T_03605 [Terriglobia bacterium]